MITFYYIPAVMLSLQLIDSLSCNVLQLSIVESSRNLPSADFCNKTKQFSERILFITIIEHGRAHTHAHNRQNCAKAKEQQNNCINHTHFKW